MINYMTSFGKQAFKAAESPFYLVLSVFVLTSSFSPFPFLFLFLLFSLSSASLSPLPPHCSSLMLGMEPRTFHILNTCFTTELCPQPLFRLFVLWNKISKLYGTLWMIWIIFTNKEMTLKFSLLLAVAYRLSYVSLFPFPQLRHKKNVAFWVIIKLNELISSQPLEWQLVKSHWGWNCFL